MSKQIILASSSPRRKELLALADIAFELRIPDIDESLRPKEKPVAMVKRLSNEKAHAVHQQFSTSKTSGIIIAADTTVVSYKNEILGKPASPREAMKMIADLQARAHFVYTGYSLLEVVRGKIARQITESVRTRVFIRALSAKEIRAYVAKGESMDKAGAYAAQGVGMGLVERIDGSYTNVVGLPLAEVIRDLKALGWKA